MVIGNPKYISSNVVTLDINTRIVRGDDPVMNKRQSYKLQIRFCEHCLLYTVHIAVDSMWLCLEEPKDAQVGKITCTKLLVTGKSGDHLPFKKLIPLRLDGWVADDEFIKELSRDFSEDIVFADTPKHVFPCHDWLSEKSCATCRGIAEERRLNAEIRDAMDDLEE